MRACKGFMNGRQRVIWMGVCLGVRRVGGGGGVRRVWIERSFDRLTEEERGRFGESTPGECARDSITSTSTARRKDRQRHPKATHVLRRAHSVISSTTLVRPSLHRHHITTLSHSPTVILEHPLILSPACPPHARRPQPLVCDSATRAGAVSASRTLRPPQD
jgi:hypothetical protein